MARTPPVLELVDGRCRFQFSVPLVDLAVRRFLWFFFETRVNTNWDPLERSPWRAFPHRPRFHMRTIGLIPTTNQQSIIYVYKSMFPMKKGINNVNILYTGLYKRSKVYYGQQMKNFKSAYYCIVCIELNVMKLTCVTHMYKNMLAIKVVLIALSFHV